MPEPLWYGLNHALPLQEPLQLNFYREAEKKILRTKVTVFNAANINILIQRMLAEKGFDRSVPSVANMRWRIGLCKKSEILRIENIAIEYWNFVEGALVSRFHGKFAFLTRAEQAEEFMDVLEEFGVRRTLNTCRDIVAQLFPAYSVQRRPNFDPIRDNEAAVKIAHEIRKRHSAIPTRPSWHGRASYGSKAHQSALDGHPTVLTGV
jgi:hypothetical protein